MGRGSGGGGSGYRGGGGGYRGGGRPRVARGSAPPPQKANTPAASVAATIRSSVGSFLVNVREGFGFGTGIAVAHRAVDFLFGGRNINVHHETPHNSSTTMGGGYDACTVHSKTFQDCLNGYGNDISRCQFYMDMLTECKRNKFIGTIHYS